MQFRAFPTILTASHCANRVDGVRCFVDTAITTPPAAAPLPPPWLPNAVPTSSASTAPTALPIPTVATTTTTTFSNTTSVADGRGTTSIHLVLQLRFLTARGLGESMGVHGMPAR